MTNPEPAWINEFSKSVGDSVQLLLAENTKEVEERIATRIEKIIQHREIINGFQPFGYTDESKEKEIFSAGFNDGRALMVIDLIQLLSTITHQEQEP